MVATLQERHLQRSYTLKSGVARFKKDKDWKKKLLDRKIVAPAVERFSKEEIQKALFVEKKSKTGGSIYVRAYKLPKKYTPGGARVQKPAKKERKPATRVKKTLTPGTVCIILKGQYAGVRGVFLKLMPGGLILVAGPKKWNGMPVRRIQQSFVLATSTKVDISNIKFPDEITDEFFKKPKVKKPKDGVWEVPLEEFKKPSPEKLAVLEKVDKQVMDAVLAHPEGPMLKRYIKRRFTLSDKLLPHQMKF